MVYLISQGVADPNHLPTSIPRLLNLIEASEMGSVTRSFAFTGGRYRTRVDSEKIPGLSETNQGAPSMSISMETNTAAIYLKTYLPTVTITLCPDC